jgi:hypothetical protein
MKFFKRIASRLSFWRKQRVLEKGNHLVGSQYLNSDRIQYLLDAYNCVDEQELIITLAHKQFNFNELTEEESLFYNNPEWDDVVSSLSLCFSLHSEGLYARKMAVRELIENRYKILPNESVNPSKEVINLVLKHFANLYRHDPISADQLLQIDFPLMGSFLRREILKNSVEVDNFDSIDEQKGFEEFLFSCKKIFCSLHPDKVTRDEHIKQCLPISSDDFIQFIDGEIACELDIENGMKCIVQMNWMLENEGPMKTIDCGFDDSSWGMDFYAVELKNEKVIDESSLIFYNSLDRTESGKITTKNRSVVCKQGISLDDIMDGSEDWNPEYDVIFSVDLGNENLPADKYIFLVGRPRTDSKNCIEWIDRERIESVKNEKAYVEVFIDGQSKMKSIPFYYNRFGALGILILEKKFGKWRFKINNDPIQNGLLELVSRYF